MNSGGVGERLTRSSSGLSHETNTNAQRIHFVTSSVLILLPLGIKLLELPDPVRRTVVRRL